MIGAINPASLFLAVCAYFWVPGVRVARRLSSDGLPSQGLLMFLSAIPSLPF